MTFTSRAYTLVAIALAVGCKDPLRDAQALHANGQPELAEEALLKFVVENPGSGDAFTLLGDLALERAFRSHERDEFMREAQVAGDRYATALKLTSGASVELRAKDALSRAFNGDTDGVADLEELWKCCKSTVGFLSRKPVKSASSLLEASVAHLNWSAEWQLGNVDRRTEWLVVKPSGGKVYSDAGLPVRMADAWEQLSFVAEESGRLAFIDEKHPVRTTRSGYVEGCGDATPGGLSCRSGGEPKLPYSKVNLHDSELRRWQDERYVSVTHIKCNGNGLGVAIPGEKYKFCPAELTVETAVKRYIDSTAVYAIERDWARPDFLKPVALLLASGSRHDLLELMYSGKFGAGAPIWAIPLTGMPRVAVVDDGGIFLNYEDRLGSFEFVDGVLVKWESGEAAPSGKGSP